MAENQQDKALQAFRTKIDGIDEQIISLLKARMEVIAEVAEYKKNNREKFFIKSAREADMIKELTKKAGVDFPKILIVDLWRKIITAANMREQKLAVALHNPKNLAIYPALVRGYYCDSLPLTNFDSAASVVLELEKNEAQIGIFALPHQSDEREKKEDMNENWWMTLANNHLGLKVFAKIPFVEFPNDEQNQIQLVAVAIKEPEKSSSDNTLLYVEAAKEISTSQILAALKEQNFSAKILKSVKLQQVDGIAFHLIELEGFHQETELAAFTKSKLRPFIKILGHYATPIKL
jgi:chorismate mutase/prephenate dehydratase